MRSKYSLMVVVAILAVASCRDTASKWRVKTKFNIHKVSFDGHEQSFGGTTDTFYYAADGKPAYSDSGATTKEERKENMVERTTYDKAGKLTGSTTTFLNEKGLEDSVVIRDKDHITYIHKYVYDGNGYVIEDRQYQPQPPNLILKYKVVDGNRVEETIINIPSLDTVMMPNPVTGEMEQAITRYDNMVIHKEYFLDKLNMPTIQNFGFTDKDITSKNLEKRAVQLSLQGETLDIYFFRYTFDEKGRVITAAQISRSGSEYDSTAYTYY